MKKRSAFEPLELLTVLVPGGIALFILGRTLAVYFRRDTIASAIVCAMGLALVCGLVELLLRLRRAARIEHEVRALPTTPSEETVDGASPLLSALLRARLEQSPLPSLGESIAPYLTGLLVMLGLLGTLLGLFEAVHGAGDALTTSADVTALRNSLTTPIAGLTRSFGCSAAGISASALLGLAIALVRRRESRSLRAVYAYAAGPLRMLSPARRQARALEQLASQSLALPQTSTALEQVGAQLGALSGELVGMQAAALEGQKQALSVLFEGLRGELGKVAEDAGAALHARVAPLVSDTLVRVGEAAREQASGLASATLSLTRELESDARARRAEASELVVTLGTRLDRAERARAEAHRAELSGLTELATRALNEATERERVLEARWTELAERLDAATRLLRDDEEARHARLEALAQRVGEDLEQLSHKLGAQLDSRLAREEAHDERARLALDRLAESATLIEASTGRNGEALEALVQRLPPLFTELAEAAQKSAQEAIAQLAESTEAAQKSAQEAIAQLAESTDARLERVSAALSDQLVLRAESERAHEERARATMERLGESAGLLEASIASQSEALDALVRRVGTLFGELAEASQRGAQATLARLEASAEVQAQRFVALEAKLESGRAEHASGLAQQLEAQAERLEQKLASASATVQEAAAIWKASSVEMQAVAELFASSIERQREASDAWLESLGEVEGAVERAGRNAAADALSDQLASTQEVFARQLQFQRELFEQLRTLRGGATRSSHGEHDVSV